MYEAFIYIGTQFRVKVMPPAPLRDSDGVDWPDAWPTVEAASRAAVTVTDMIPEAVREGQQIEWEVVS